MSCFVVLSHGLNRALLWLCCRQEAVALIRPLAWELPYAMGAALNAKIYIYIYILLTCEHVHLCSVSA